MITPFVIDNQQHKMAGVLNDLLAHYQGHSLDVATAYFNVGGWQLLRDGLNGLGNFRLLLGDEPEAGSDLGLREIGAKPVKGLIRDLARENFYDLKRLHNDLRRDFEALRSIWHEISTITADRDAKLARLKELLAGELKGQKVLLFTYYKDTARYLYHELSGDDPAAAAWQVEAGEPRIRRMDSGADARERARLVAEFAPRANHKPEIAGTDREIDVLISTDVLSEGQNVQDCGVLVNYDLHWNPTRMVQRAGRIDRIGTSFDTLWVHNMFPDAGLEKLLGLVESLSQKIASIDQSGFLDASVLGEVVHPRNFNTLRRIEEEDGKVVEEQEQFAELVSSEFLLQNLKNLLDAGMRRMLEELPDGIHSGLVREGAKGLFFYFTAPAGGKSTAASERTAQQHFWRYLDLSGDTRGGRVEDNRYVITNLIQCQPDTPRIVLVDSEVDIFELGCWKRLRSCFIA